MPGTLVLGILVDAFRPDYLHGHFQKISRMYPDNFGSAVNQIVEDR
jgi:hypothetical protein